MEYDLELQLFSITPVVNCELEPIARLTKKGSYAMPPQHSLKCKWYRNQKRVLFTCCVHHDKISTVQCIECVKYGLPVEKSHYCSAECFEEDWQNHCKCHPARSVNDIKSEHDDDDISSSNWDDPGISTEEGESWIEIGSSETYTPTFHDYGYRLKLQSQAIDCEGLPLTQTGVIVTDAVIIAPPPCLREMIQLGPVSNLSFNTQTHPTATVRILTYNVLVDYNSLKAAYPYCPTWALTWDYRRQNLLHEIVGYDADILCLQEVQNNHFESFYKPQLEQLGYSVCYKRKTRGVYTGKNTNDGCATFFHNGRFKQVGASALDFHATGLLTHETLSPEHKKTVKPHHLAKDNLAVLVMLMALENGAVFYVANTHIHANPREKDVKLLQVATLINNLERDCGSNIPVLVCADLNSLPGSAPHELVVNGYVDRSHKDLKDSPIAMFETTKLYHGLSLASAYSSLLNNTSLISNDQRKKMDPETKEPRFTNCTPGFVGAIDYIFYSERNFTVSRLLELVDLQSVKGTCLPSPYWSSDHIALMAEFILHV